MTSTKPVYETRNCGMEVNMYAPDEEGEVLFRNARLQKERNWKRSVRKPEVPR